MYHIPPSRRPLVGVTVSAEHSAENPQDVEKLLVYQRYLDVLWRAGAMPIPLSYTTNTDKLADYAATLDGVLFSGGGDIAPTLYGAPDDHDPRMSIHPARDIFEMALFHAIYPLEKPVLGICRGIQLINVCLGGTLWPHIEGHSQKRPGTARPQAVTLAPGGVLHRLSGKTTLHVNTFHHQSIHDLAPPLTADALADDGTIEAVYAPDHRFLLGVQFHPEFYAFGENDDHGYALFEAFVQSAKNPYL